MGGAGCCAWCLREVLQPSSLMAGVKEVIARLHVYLEVGDMSGEDGTWSLGGEGGREERRGVRRGGEGEEESGIGLVKLCLKYFYCFIPKLFTYYSFDRYLLFLFF